MRRSSSYLPHFLILPVVILLTGCSDGPTSGAGPTSALPSDAMSIPLSSPSATPPDLPDSSARAPTSASAAPVELLPHSLYFLSNDDAGLSQLFLIGRDGETKSQLTSEPADVTDYDVSVADGSIAYVSSNQLMLVNADGLSRRVLADGGPRESSFWITNPVFSPDGSTLAFGHQGVNLYDLAAGSAQLVISDQYSTVTLPNGLRLPFETYEPERYAPDGTKLLVGVGHPPDSPQTAAIYTPADDALVHLSGGEEGLTCCNFFGGAAWSADGSALYSVAGFYDSTYRFGVLWRVDGTSGEISTLIPGRADDGPFNLPMQPHLARDGRLYFFFGSYDADSGYLDAPAVSLVRAEPDGATGWTVLRDENFVLMVEALWAPDASMVVVSSAPSRTWNLDGGVLELYDTEGQRGRVWLAPIGHQMKWGP